MGKIPTNSLGKSSELKLHCFYLFDAYSMPKDTYSACHVTSALTNQGGVFKACLTQTEQLF